MSIFLETSEDFEKVKALSMAELGRCLSLWNISMILFIQLFEEEFGGPWKRPFLTLVRRRDTQENGVEKNLPQCLEAVEYLEEF